MKPIKLSICIASLHSRSETLNDLLDLLRGQDRFDEVELLVIADAGPGLVGDKRNRMLEMATGPYICCIDDDDEVSESYLPAILRAIDDNPGVDAIAIRGRCTTGPNGDPPVDFDYRLGGKEGEWIDGTLWRSPGHLCPIRAPLAKSIRFPTAAPRGEDLPWSKELAPLLTSLARAGEPGELLYQYRLDPAKTTPRRAAYDAKKDHESIFTPQYKERSGPGSTAEFSAPYREFLAQFIREHQVRSIVDLGCGDLEVMSRVDVNGARYRGADIIKERVQRNTARHPHWRFEQRDVRAWEFPRTDLVVCKDVVQHWSTPEIAQFLDHLRACGNLFRYALITNCNYGATVNGETPTGGWRAIDLTAAPFSIGDVVFRWGTPNKDVVLIRGRRR